MLTNTYNNFVSGIASILSMSYPNMDHVFLALIPFQYTSWFILKTEPLGTFYHLVFIS